MKKNCCKAAICLLFTLLMQGCCWAQESSRADLEKCLATQYIEVSKAGEHPELWLKMLGDSPENVRVMSVTEQELMVESKGFQFPFRWSKLTPTELALLAVTIADQNGERLMLAAELSLLAGRGESTKKLLDKAVAADVKLARRADAILKTLQIPTLPIPIEVKAPVSDKSKPATGTGTNPLTPKSVSPTSYLPQMTPNKTAGPHTYADVYHKLKPGDVLLLVAGTYMNDLHLFNLNGEPGKPIVIMGPESGPRALFKGNDSTNTVELTNCSFIIIANLEIDGQGKKGPFGVSSKKETHDITIANCHLHDINGNQQTLAISTKGPAWNWRIVGNLIERAGTGMYLGNSDGKFPFFNGIVEYNTIIDTIGYNIEIKHQESRPAVPGLTRGTTIIRHNIFAKTVWIEKNDGARPNLLVGTPPKTGPGSDDCFLIYGNFFYKNSHEALFQGEGNIDFYDNILYNPEGPGVHIQPHNGKPKTIRIFNNTVVAQSEGITVRGAESVVAEGNAVFAAKPLSGASGKENITASFEQASKFLVNPSGELGKMDFSSLPGQLQPKGKAFDLSLFKDARGYTLDFSGKAQTGQMCGAYATEGPCAGWRLTLTRIPYISEPTPAQPGSILKK